MGEHSRSAVSSLPIAVGYVGVFLPVLTSKQGMGWEGGGTTVRREDPAG